MPGAHAEPADCRQVKRPYRIQDIHRQGRAGKQADQATDKEKVKIAVLQILRDQQRLGRQNDREDQDGKAQLFQPEAEARKAVAHQAVNGHRQQGADKAYPHGLPQGFHVLHPRKRLTNIGHGKALRYPHHQGIQHLVAWPERHGKDIENGIQQDKGEACQNDGAAQRVDGSPRPFAALEGGGPGGRPVRWMLSYGLTSLQLSRSSA